MDNFEHFIHKMKKAAKLSQREVHGIGKGRDMVQWCL